MTKIYLIEYGNCYEPMQVYEDAFRSKDDADEQAAKIEKGFDDDMGANYVFRDQYVAYVIEVKLK